MEGNKTAMYEQAGRSRGWTKVNSDDVLKIPMAPTAPVMPPMPAPPVVVAPVVVAPEPYKSANDCQTLAMAYVSTQKWQELYEPEQGLERGTLFCELDLPFVGEGACRYE